MFSSLLAASLLSLALSASAFPEYRSLAGLSAAEVRAVARTFTSTPGAQPLPPAINDTSSKLVYDDAHPWEPLRPGDIRGPCPGLNTLASHGYLDRSGVATPGEIITAVQEGFNMGFDLAAFVTYAAFIVDGNHLTNLMSIGQKTPETGPDAPAPATIGGLNTHGAFEGDASTTRDDFALGSNFLFNETLFDQLSQAAIDFGSNGTLDINSAAVHRHNRILDSMARNPNFTFVIPRYLTAYAETTFPLAMFVSNQTSDSSMTLNLDDARSFFQNHKYPDNFFRRNGSYGNDEVGTLITEVFELFPDILPGNNEGAGNYVLDPNDPGFNGDGTCYAYYKQTNFTLSLYPDPTDELRTALQQNLATFYITLGDPTCEEVFPFGQ
ncbi:heme-thiolate peroxidase [Gymnopus androsaceus JB14]|uniref:Heme-thiolate peroxidase n=1 Tax=Gymnopus androsaceus JB14 TaxID=1447944 RepID=A0A6A4HLY6_9AGAR|nr:heme-thiolate peroxidase [Gymnopus androsaceus JB14]